MARQLDTVQKGQALTAEAWNTLVAKVNNLDKQSFDFTVQKRPKGGETRIAPMRLQTDWQQVNGQWTATCCEVLQDGSFDTDHIVDVYAPTFTSRPNGTALVWRFWALFRNGRWETLQSPGGESVNYVGGVGIDVGAYDSVLGGRPITNMGVRSVVIPGSGYEARADALYLASNHFKWRDSSTTTGKEACLKTRRLSVVTNIENGVPVKEVIEVIGVD